MFESIPGVSCSVLEFSPATQEIDRGLIPRQRTSLLLFLMLPESLLEIRSLIFIIRRGQLSHVV